MSTNPKSYEILSGLKTIFETITTNNGYNFDIKNITFEEWVAQSWSNKHTPAIWIRGDREELEPISNVEYKSRFYIYLHCMIDIESSRTGKMQRLHQFVRDVREAVVSDLTIGGIVGVYDTVIENVTYPYIWADDIMKFTIPIVVHYYYSDSTP